MDDLAMKALPGTDLTIGPIIIGTMTFGSRLDLDESRSVVEKSREFGVTMFDTANSYNEGQSEEILGQILRSYRDEIQIASKVGSHRFNAQPEPPLRRQRIIDECDGSLRRLGTDYLDLFYLHMPDRDTPLEESLAACEELVQAGKVRSVAMSNYAAWQLMAARAFSTSNNSSHVCVSQQMYNMLARRLEDEYLECVRELGISTFVYNPLAGGLLTGKYERDKAPPANTRFGDLEFYVDRYWNDAQLEAVDRLKVIAEEAGHSLLSLALRWTLQQEVVDAMVLGVSSVSQLEQNFAALQAPRIDDEVLGKIDDVWALLEGPAPSYHR